MPESEDLNESTIEVKKREQNLYVSGIPTEANDHEVRSFFSQFGDVYSVHLKKKPEFSDCVGFVCFHTPEGFKRARDEVPFTPFDVIEGFQPRILHVEKFKYKTRDLDQSRVSANLLANIDQSQIQSDHPLMSEMSNKLTTLEEVVKKLEQATDKQERFTTLAQQQLSRPPEPRLTAQPLPQVSSVNSGSITYQIDDLKITKSRGPSGIIIKATSADDSIANKENSFSNTQNNYTSYNDSY